MHSPFENDHNPETVRAWHGWVAFTRAAAISSVLVSLATAFVIAILTY